MRGGWPHLCGSCIRGQHVVEVGMRYADWGQRSARWAGIRSELVGVDSISVHLLRSDASRHAPAGAPTHLLIHPMASGATFWLDVMGPLTAHGPVLAPDLPGAVFGHTAAARPSAAGAEPSARFLCALTATLGLDHVVAHGWSFGGLVALLVADQEPERVRRLVLTNPTLPGPLTAAERAGWQTLGRLALLIGPWLVRGLLGVLGPRLVGLKQRYASPQVLSGGWVSRVATCGGPLPSWSRWWPSSSKRFGPSPAGCAAAWLPSPRRCRRCLSTSAPPPRRSIGWQRPRCCCGATRTP
jgi:pimeloyl-ACP methyl ester carboxylesterase